MTSIESHFDIATTVSALEPALSLPKGLASETWECDESSLQSPQMLGAPSIRHLSDEWVRDQDPKPTLFPWCIE